MDSPALDLGNCLDTKSRQSALKAGDPTALPSHQQPCTSPSMPTFSAIQICHGKRPKYFNVCFLCFRSVFPVACQRIHESPNLESTSMISMVSVCNCFEQTLPFKKQLKTYRPCNLTQCTYPRLLHSQRLSGRQRFTDITVPISSLLLRTGATHCPLASPTANPQAWHLKPHRSAEISSSWKREHLSIWFTSRLIIWVRHSCQRGGARNGLLACRPSRVCVSPGMMGTEECQVTTHT